MCRFYKRWLGVIIGVCGEQILRSFGLVGHGVVGFIGVGLPPGSFGLCTSWRAAGCVAGHSGACPAAKGADCLCRIFSHLVFIGSFDVSSALHCQLFNRDHESEQVIGLFNLYSHARD